MVFYFAIKSLKSLFPLKESGILNKIKKKSVIASHGGDSAGWPRANRTSTTQRTRRCCRMASASSPARCRKSAKSPPVPCKDLKTVPESVYDQAKSVAENIRNKGKTAIIQGKQKLADVISLTEKLLEQAKQVISGTRVIADRIVIFFDSEARPIKKGKLAKGTEKG